MGRETLLLSWKGPKNVNQHLTGTPSGENLCCLLERKVESCMNDRLQRYSFLIKNQESISTVQLKETKTY